MSSCVHIDSNGVVKPLRNEKGKAGYPNILIKGGVNTLLNAIGFDYKGEEKAKNIYLQNLKIRGGKTFFLSVSFL